MRAVQVLFDDDLPAELDQTVEVREQGRSAVLRQLIGDFLRRRPEQEIDAQYEPASSTRFPGFGMNGDQPIVQPANPLPARRPFGRLGVAHVK